MEYEVPTFDGYRLNSMQVLVRLVRLGLALFLFNLFLFPLFLFGV